MTRPEPPPLALAVARHALFWLATGAAAGLACATLLAFPRLGILVAPLSYGRWMALHLDLTLYGWTALPLVGLLFRFFDLERREDRGRKLLAAWSAVLAAGAASWLAGRTSGKIFLDWTGGARTLFFALLAILWLALLETTLADRRKAGIPHGLTAGRGLTVAILAGVPPVLALATSRHSYPPIDPASGAPTGVSLLASTLALVAVLLALPRLARLGHRPEVRPVGRWLVALLVLHAAGAAALFGPDRWSDDGVELAAIISVLPWVVLVPLDYRAFAWPASARAWSRAATFWGALLALTGVAQFLPEALAAARFTHILVAHSHLAMAGFTSSACFLLLELGLAPGYGGEARFGGAVFSLWQIATGLHVVALAAVGAMEVGDPAAVLRGSVALSAGLALRWLAGALALAAVAQALARAWAPSRSAVEETA